MPIWKQQLLKRVMKPQGDDGGDGGGGGAGNDTLAGGAGGNDTAEGAGGSDTQPGSEGAGGGDKGAKPSDSEAKLIKEVMQKKDALKKASADLEAANARLKEFDGIDPGEIKKLIADKRSAEESQLAAKGEWETLKKRMGDEHTNAMKGVQGENETLKQALAKANSTIEELTVGTSFGNSAFIKETVYTPGKARQLYGSHFDIVDGAVVGYDKPRGTQGRAPLVDATGSNLVFDEALKRIVEADPDKDYVLKSKVKPGANSNSNARPARNGQDEPKDGVSKITAGLASLKLG